MTGFTFRPVIKAHIVHLEWETWDKSNEEPAEYPETGEPEDYLLLRPHSVETMQKMEDLWELSIDGRIEQKLVPKDPGAYGKASWAPWEISHESLLDVSTWDGTDWFRVPTGGEPLVSARTKAWLEAFAPEWVSFAPALTT